MTRLDPDSRLRYDVVLHCHPGRIRFLPNERRVQRGRYHPSPSLADALRRMLLRRAPRTVGLVSERVVTELIDGGVVTLDGHPSALSCRRLREFVARQPTVWRPGYGIRCDDLVAEGGGIDGARLVFLVEVKGTVRRHGLPRDTEAKMYYQLVRTFVKLREDPALRLAGLMAAIVDHHDWTITINVNDHSTTIARDLPDAWLYPGRSESEF